LLYQPKKGKNGMFSHPHTPIRLLTIAYLIIGIIFAVNTPLWQTPDEPAHYHYVAQVATIGLPVIEAGDWDSAYLDELKSTRFIDIDSTTFSSIQYEDHQPPLYYLLASPIYRLTKGNPYAIRIFSVMIGMIIVWCAYGVGRLIFPDSPAIALGVAGFVAFHPQQLHIIASVNNDVLAWALVGMMLVMAIAHLKTDDQRLPLWMGVIVGIAFITKATAYFLLAVGLLAILLKRRNILRELMLYIPPALILGLIWWIRNISVYGFPDFLGLRAHDAVVVGQLRTSERLAELGFGGYSAELFQTTFNSFWGQFGWMAVPMPSWIYMGILALLIVAFIGLFIYHRDNNQRPVWILLISTIALSVLAYLYYNSEFVQYQGRYMFPMLIPLGIFLVIGIDNWRIRLLGGMKYRFVAYLTAIPFLGMAVLDVYLIWRVIATNL
jgi:4-amino-4-deoxy-L-arabinose transferase-like glycosyltransferase